MRLNKEGLIVEITDQEVRLLLFSFKRKPGNGQGLSDIALNKNWVIYERVQLDEGVVAQGLIQQPQVLSSALRAFLTKQSRKLSKLPVFLALPAQHGFIRHFSLPWIAPHLRAKTLWHLVEEEVPFPEGDKLYDYLTLDESVQENRWHVLILAARDSLAQAYVSPLVQAGLRVQGVGLPIAHLGHTLELEPDEHLVYLNVEQGHIQFVMYHGKIPEIVRTLAVDTDLSDQVAFVRRVLLYYALQQTPGRIRKIIADGEEARMLAARLVEQEVAPLWEGAEKPYLTLFSYAEALSAKGKRLNLWREHEQARRKLKRGRAVLALGMISLVLMSAALIPLIREKSGLAAEVQVLRVQGERMRQEQEKQASLTQAWQNVLFHPVPVGESLKKVQTSISPRVALTDLEYKQGGLNLKGKASAPGEVEAVMKGLKEIGWGQPILTSYRQEGEIIEFDISTSISSKK